MKSKSELKIAFLGTPEFAVPSLRMLVEEGYRVCGVFTQPDRPKGRGHKMCIRDRFFERQIKKTTLFHFSQNFQGQLPLLHALLPFHAISGKENAASPSQKILGVHLLCPGILQPQNFNRALPAGNNQPLFCAGLQNLPEIGRASCRERV